MRLLLCDYKECTLPITKSHTSSWKTFSTITRWPKQEVNISDSTNALQWLKIQETPPVCPWQDVHCSNTFCNCSQCFADQQWEPSSGAALPILQAAGDCVRQPVLQPDTETGSWLAIWTLFFCKRGPLPLKALHQPADLRRQVRCDLCCNQC